MQGEGKRADGAGAAAARRKAGRGVGIGVDAAARRAVEDDESESEEAASSEECKAGGAEAPGDGGGAGGQWEEVSMDDVALGAQIGGGGFALVFQGTWKRRRVALKTLFDPRADESTKQEFMAELYTMSGLQHPNIVALKGACVRAPKYCMVLELCDMSLFDALHGHGQQQQLQLSEKELVRMGAEVCSALDYLHNQSPAIIHRDVKSQNVLLTRDLTIKLCDFGLVSTGVTFAGTPAYMAPELLSNGLFSKKVDVYAFAVLLWEMFTACVPFATWDVRDIRDFVTAGKRLELPRSGYPKQCGALIARCWDADPERRPAFSAIARALTRIHSSLRDVSHLDELAAADSFDALSSQVGGRGAKK